MNLSAFFVIGTVCEIDEKAYCVKVECEQLDGFKTDMLPLMTTTAQHRGFYSMPEKGAQVVVLLDADGNGGVVLGSLYNKKDTPQQNTQKKTAYNFANGTEILHNEEDGLIKITTKGDVNGKCNNIIINNDGDITITTRGSTTVTTSGTVDMTSSAFTLTGDTTINGKLTVSSDVKLGANLEVSGNSKAAEHTSGGVNLTKHTHVCNMSGSPTAKGVG